jgi:protein-S-isoprenylcysteine O-methyltransferase Ste14
MEISGKPTINPFLFYSGKTCGYIGWLALALALAGIKLPGSHTLFLNNIIALFLMIAGLMIITLSLVSLGGSTRIGLPTVETKLKTKGLYMFSRNPMYIGFHLVTAAAVIYTLNLSLFLISIYSMIIYHLIILGEEKFLDEKFGPEYQEYKKKVNRYL